MTEMTRPGKILIVRLGSLGDIIHTIPAQQRICEYLPGAEVHWLAEPPYQSFLSCVSGISRVWEADTQKWRRNLFSAGEFLRLIRSLRSERFDIALDFQGLVKSAFLAKFSGADQVVGFASERFKEPAAQYFYSATVVGDDGTKPHVIKINLQLARFLGCPVNGASARIPLNIPPQASEYVEQSLRRLGVSRPVIVNPGAGWVTKRWPARNYAQLSLLIERELKLPVILTCGPGEEELMEQVLREAGAQSLRTFPTSILELAALCRLSRLMVAGDTGPLHLAVALGTPTVAILGPTAPWRNGPFHPVDIVVKRYLPCSDSYKRTCDQWICMDIPVAEVFKAVARRIEQADLIQAH